MKIHFKAEIYHSVDLTESKQTHVSISGGKATHSFNYIDSLKANTLDELKKLINKKYGEIYDQDEDKFYINIPESDWSEKECYENYEAFISKITEHDINLNEEN